MKENSGTSYPHSFQGKAETKGLLLMNVEGVNSEITDVNPMSEKVSSSEIQ